MSRRRTAWTTSDWRAHLASLTTDYLVDLARGHNVQIPRQGDGAPARVTLFERLLEVLSPGETARDEGGTNG